MDFRVSELNIFWLLLNSRWKFYLTVNDFGSSSFSRPYKPNEYYTRRKLFHSAKYDGWISNFRMFDIVFYRFGRQCWEKVFLESLFVLCGQLFLSDFDINFVPVVGGWQCHHHGCFKSLTSWGLPCFVFLLRCTACQFSIFSTILNLVLVTFPLNNWLTIVAIDRLWIVRWAMSSWGDYPLGWLPLRGNRVSRSLSGVFLVTYILILSFPVVIWFVFMSILSAPTFESPWWLVRSLPKFPSLSNYPCRFGCIW